MHYRRQVMTATQRHAQISKGDTSRSGRRLMNEWMNECNLTLWRSKESQTICKSVFYFYDEIIKVVLQEANHNSRQR